MNSIDRELLEQARDLLELVDITPTNTHQWERQTPEWRARVMTWIAATQAAGVPARPRPETVTVTGPAYVAPLPNTPTRGQEARWLPISKDGEVSAFPAPENPDEQDEGETGPPEVQQ